MYSLHNIFSAGSEGVRLAFSPNESHQKGGGSLTLAFSEETPLRHDADYFVCFEGQTLRHLVSARRVNPVTFRSIIPEHRKSELVRLSVVMYRENTIKILASSVFRYLPDDLQMFAEFLVSSVYDPGSLENLDRLKIEFKNAFKLDLVQLDRQVCWCLSKIALPDGWSLIITNSYEPQETLLHLCARLGLYWTACYLLQMPGADRARSLPNIQDDTPADLSNMYNHLHMTGLFSGKTVCWSGDPPWSALDRQEKSTIATKIRRIEKEIFMLTSDSRDQQKSLHRDLELMQEVLSAGKRRPTSTTTCSQKIRFAGDSPTHSPTGTTQRSPSSSPRMRSKSGINYGRICTKYNVGGIIHEDANRESEEDSNSSDQHSNHRIRHRRHQRESSQLSSHHEHHNAYQPFMARPIQDNSVRNCSAIIRRQSESFTVGVGDCSNHDRHKFNRSVSASSADWDQPVLEESLRKLQEIRENLRLVADQSKPSENEDERRDRLSRFSTSCPSINESLSPLENVQFTDHHEEDLFPKEPVFSALAISSSVSLSPQLPNPDRLSINYLTTSNHNPEDMNHQDITIRINDVTVDSTEDFNVPPPGGSEETNLAYIEQIKKANKRRSSWCPEEGRKKEEKQEKQKMLNISGRSQSLSSLDGDSDEDDEDDDDEGSSTSSSYQNIPGDTSPTHYGGGTPSHSPTGICVPMNGAGISLSEQAGRHLAREHKKQVVGDVERMSPGDCHVSHSGPLSPGDPHSPIDDPQILMYPSVLSKASSSPSIANNSHHDNKGVLKLDFHEQNKMLGLSGEDTEEDSDSRSEWVKGQPAGALTDTTDSAMAADEEPKIEKKRKSSVFSKFGSYRQKKPQAVKGAKLIINSHEFVSVCFSLTAPCDVCSKSMANKPALQCENCQVNVHDNSCKEQIAPCAKYKPSRYNNGDNGREKKCCSLPESVNHNVTLKTSQSFKEPRRAISVPARPALQCSASSSALAPRSSSPSRVITEERDKTKDDDPAQSSSPQLLETTNITDTLSVSMESLDEGSNELADFEDEFADEPEAWSVTVDKKTLKKMSAKDIKRQDHIWELIQTERSHCRTLRIMQKIFSKGMRTEAGISQDMIDRIFPRLTDLIEIHTTFLYRLREKQRHHSDKHIDDVGDVLVNQFDGEMGQRMKIAYGDFCSKHAMAVQLYKDIHKSDRKFQSFIKKCSRTVVCKRLSIPECILLVTQRVTKYPLLIEPIIKTTKAENRNDKERLLRALPLMREILIYIDAQVDAHEKDQRLIEIYNKLDARSYALYGGEKFKKSNLLGSRKLIHEGYMKWMTARGKAFEVLAVILSDVMFFLAETNQKLTFFSQDSKSSVVPLSKLLVREKGDTRDSKGIYLIWQSKTEPEMYEFVCRTAEERKVWIRVIKSAVLRCMEAEGVYTSGQPEIEVEKKELEAKSARIRQLVDRLYERDGIVRQICDEKMALIVEMLEIFCREELNKSQLQSVFKEEEGGENIDPAVWSALKVYIQDSSQYLSEYLLNLPLSSQAASSDKTSQNTEVNAPSLPKRAETFSGFDQKEKVKKRYNSGHLEEGERSDSQQSLNESEIASAPKESTKEKTKSRHNSFLGGLLKSSGNDSESERTQPESRDTSHDTKKEFGPRLQSLMSTPSREQCESLAQLMQYLHNLVCITSAQLTEVEKFRAQLSEANSKVSMLYAENKRLSHGFHHDEQLEMLREQQEQLRQERVQLDRLRDYDRQEREEETAKVLKLKEELEKEKAEVRAQKEAMQHEKEVLQRQMDLFEENKRRILQATETAKGLNFREGSESPAPRGVSPSSQASQNSLLEISHKRSASDDLSRSSPDRSMDATGKDSSKIRGNVSNVRQNSANQLPIHLLSATNELKAVHVSQQLPFKLAIGSSKSPQAQSTSVNPAAKTPTPQQMLPFKLSSGSQSQPKPPTTVSPRPQVTAKAATLDGSGSRTQRQAMPVSRTNSGSQLPGGMALNMLPMKLAERARPKSASSASVNAISPPATDSTEQSHSHKRSSSSNRATEEEIIYF